MSITVQPKHMCTRAMRASGQHTTTNTHWTQTLSKNGQLHHLWGCPSVVDVVAHSDLGIFTPDEQCCWIPAPSPAAHSSEYSATPCHQFLFFENVSTRSGSRRWMAMMAEELAPPCEIHVQVQAENRWMWFSPKDFP
mmetsp:Transcript_20832/g.40258  ORF Transcript_20832/g.40258 Transcript_20832/m.40258 type:complete len:137 (-) Transcript_20832:679-1089(-)